MTMPYRTLAGMDEARRRQIRDEATRFLGTLSAKPDDHQSSQTAKPR